MSMKSQGACRVKYRLQTLHLRRLVWAGLLLFLFYSHRSESRPVTNLPSTLSAEALIEAGKRALQNKDYRRAAEAFETAFVRNPQPVILCHLGSLASAQGQSVAAADFFQRCLAQLPASADPALRQNAQAMLAQTPAPAGEISFVSPKDGFLWIDERLTARLAAGERLIVQVAAGHHTLRFTIAGATTSETTEIDIKRDERLNVRCDARGISVLSPFSVLLILQDEPGGLWQTPQQQQKAWQSVDVVISQESGALIPLARVQQPGTQAAKSWACRHQPACQIALGQQVGASYVLVLKTQHDSIPNPSTATNYQLSSALLDTRVELQSTFESTSCTGCTEESLLPKLAELARRTFLGGRRPIGWLEVQTPRAEITVDGSLRVRTPCKHPVFVGSHKLTLSRPYFADASTEVMVEQDETTPFNPQLVPLPLSRGERAVRIGRWVFGGTGLAMIAVGAGLFAREDSFLSPTSSDEYLNQVSTKTPGIALLAGGAAAVGISIALFATDVYYSRRRR